MSFACFISLSRKNRELFTMLAIVWRRNNSRATTSVTKSISSGIECVSQLLGNVEVNLFSLSTQYILLPLPLMLPTVQFDIYTHVSLGVYAKMHRSLCVRFSHKFYAKMCSFQRVKLILPSCISRGYMRSMTSGDISVLPT